MIFQWVTPDSGVPEHGRIKPGPGGGVKLSAGIVRWISGAGRSPGYGSLGRAVMITIAWAMGGSSVMLRSI